MRNSESLATLLDSKDFKAAVESVAQRTLHHGVEAGFAVYANDGRFEVSRVIDARNRDTSVLQSAAQAMKTPYISLDMAELLDDEREDRPRRDLALVLHSHPTDSGIICQPEDYLIPSPIDLDLHIEEDMLNPGIVEGVAIVNSIPYIARILLTRITDYDKPARYQTLDDFAPRAVMLRAMHESGIATAEVTLDLQESKYIGNIALQTSGLFVTEQARAKTAR